MKMLKIFAIVIVVFVVLVLGGAFIFIKTFDVNAYLPQITKAASQAMGQELTVQKAHLDISFKGLALNCQDIAITDVKNHKEPIVKVADARVGVDFWPFLTTRKLDFKSIEITDIKVHVDDDKMPLDIIVPQMHARVEDFSLTDPYHIQIDIRVASKVENVHMNAQVLLDSARGKITVSDMVLRSDLAQLTMEDVRAISPALKTAVLPVAVSGDLKVDVMHLAFGANGLEGLQARAILENGGAQLKEIPKPISSSRFDADIDLTKINVREFHLHIGDGSINGQAEISNYMTVANIQSKGNIDGIKIDDLVDVNILPVVLKGKLNASGNLAAQSFDPKELMRTLKGQGEFNITEGTIEKLNIVKSILGPTFGLIPGLAEGVDSLLSGAIKDQIGDMTVLDKAFAQFRVENQVVSIDEAQVQTKPFDLTAKGTVTLGLDTNIQTDVLLSKDLSDQITAKVEQMGYLRDENGRIKVSGDVQGVIPSLIFKPNVDVKTTAKNAIIEEGGKQLQKVIEKNPEVGNILNSIFGESKASDLNESSQDSTEKAKNAIGNVLNSILK